MDRYFIGWQSMKKLPSWANYLTLFVFCLLAGCGAWESIPGPTDNDPRSAFSAPQKSEKISPASAVEAFRATTVDEYHLWDGDQINIDIVGRPELSGQQIVGPDGDITLPVAGAVKVRDLSREKAAEAIVKALSHYYKNVYATIRVNTYDSNRVVVLGRVEHPGPVQFDTPPTLIEILSKAGGFPLLRPEQVLTRCAVIRGNQILWVDVARLLSGDLTLNVKLQRNDVVYIPDAFDTSVFVLGAVSKPGAYRLTPQMSILDALGQAGGPLEAGNMRKIHVIRPDKGVNLELDLEELMAPDPKMILALKEGDIVFVPRSDIAQVGYYLRTLSPFSQLITVGTMLGTM